MSGKRKYAKKKRAGRGRRNNTNKTNGAGARKRPTKITDLNDHCLATIFSYLNLRDLINVALSNTRFSVGTRTAFLKNYSEKAMYVSNKFNRRHKILLKHFGSVIKHLEVQYDEDYHRLNHQLEANVSKYCNKTLIGLVLSDFNEFLFNQIKEPFEKVEELWLSGGVLGEFPMNLRKWFPNLVHLQLSHTSFEEPNFAKCIEQTIPTLEKLRIEESSGFTNANLKMAFQLNPQLKSINLTLVHSHGININHDLLRFVKEKLLRLETLGIFCGRFHEIDGFDAAVHFDNLKEIGFGYYDSNFDFCPLKSSQLDALFFFFYVIDENCCKFISKQKCKNLQLSYEWQSNDVCNAVIDCIASLPGLENIIMPYTGLNGNQAEILSLLKNCNSLKKLVVIEYDRTHRSSKKYKAFTEGFHNTFEAEGFANAWAATYYKEKDGFCAEYKKQEEN